MSEKVKRKPKSVRVVRLTHVHQRQHHEDERLQRDDQNVEDGPDRTSNDVTDRQQYARQCGSSSAAHQSDQHENQFASVHVAEQSHAVRNGFGSELDHLHDEVNRPQERVRTKGSTEQLMHPTAKTFDFDVVENTNQQNIS